MGQRGSVREGLALQAKLGLAPSLSSDQTRTGSSRLGLVEETVI